MVRRESSRFISSILPASQYGLLHSACKHDSEIARTGLRTPREGLISALISFQFQPTNHSQRAQVLERVLGLSGACSGVPGRDS